MNIWEKVQEILGEEISLPPAPIASYVPWRMAQNFLLISGQLPVKGGKLLAEGKIPIEVSEEQGKLCAQWCAVNLLGHLQEALNQSGKELEQLVRITGYIACTPEFSRMHLILNGASDFLIAVLGEAGRHTREAVGVSSLPLNAPVEISAWALVK
ncbi:MAG: RidA family protein [bacterium JZ-2024 1]